MTLKFIGWQKLWLLSVVFYGVVVIKIAINEHDYIYESKQYENVMGDMAVDYRTFYFSQKCNNLETNHDAFEPKCYSLQTIDDGTLNFDATTSRTEAANVLQAYNQAAYKYVFIASGKFVVKFLLIWAVPALLLYLLGAVYQRFRVKKTSPCL
ncbi:MAG: hypothetical protein HXX17_09570 [Geobacteraceae bacterium]|nr:hypothetical protein [Geobacteraceae bacterium]